MAIVLAIALYLLPSSSYPYPLLYPYLYLYPGPNTAWVHYNVQHAWWYRFQVLAGNLDLTPIPNPSQILHPTPTPPNVFKCFAGSPNPSPNPSAHIPQV